MSEQLEQVLLDLLSAREGHFLMESGYHTGLWLDLDPLFVSPGRLGPVVEALAAKLRAHNIDAVCGPLLGGAFLAQAIASSLDLEFYYAERFAPAVRDTLFSVEYRIPASVGSRLGGKSVAVVDDVISAGSAVRGTITSLEAHGGKPVVVGALLVMSDQADEFCRERDLALEYVAKLPHKIWLPGDCPLCASGQPLVDIVAP
jgi:orotate phosphoribosyltransferase